MSDLQPFFGFMPSMEWVVIGGIALLLFGSTKLPKLARSLGQSVVEFKRGVKAVKEEDERDEQLPPSEEERRKKKDGDDA